MQVIVKPTIHCNILCSHEVAWKPPARKTDTGTPCGNFEAVTEFLTRPICFEAYLTDMRFRLKDAMPNAEGTCGCQPDQPNPRLTRAEAFGVYAPPSASTLSNEERKSTPSAFYKTATHHDSSFTFCGSYITEVVISQQWCSIHPRGLHLSPTFRTRFHYGSLDLTRTMAELRTSLREILLPVA